MRGGVKANVLNDVDEKSFDRAFNIIRPVIQGTGDIGVDSNAQGDLKLNEQEVRGTMDFVFRLFSHPPKGAVENHDHPDDGLHGNVADLDRDARARLASLSKTIPHLMGYDGVKHILDDARETIRLQVKGDTATKLAPIVPV